MRLFQKSLIFLFYFYHRIAKRKLLHITQYSFWYHCEKGKKSLRRNFKYNLLNLLLQRNCTQHWRKMSKQSTDSVRPKLSNAFFYYSTLSPLFRMCSSVTPVCTVYFSKLFLRFVSTLTKFTAHPCLSLRPLHLRNVNSSSISAREERPARYSAVFCPQSQQAFSIC